MLNDNSTVGNIYSTDNVNITSVMNVPINASIPLANSLARETAVVTTATDARTAVTNRNQKNLESQTRSTKGGKEIPINRMKLQFGYRDTSNIYLQILWKLTIVMEQTTFGSPISALAFAQDTLSIAIAQGNFTNTLIQTYSGNLPIMNGVTIAVNSFAQNISVKVARTASPSTNPTPMPSFINKKAEMWWIITVCVAGGFIIGLIIGFLTYYSKHSKVFQNSFNK